MDVPSVEKENCNAWHTFLHHYRLFGIVSTVRASVTRLSSAMRHHGEAHHGCDKPRLVFTLFCCNIKGDHPANYRGCIKFIEAEQKQRSTRPGDQNRVSSSGPKPTSGFSATLWFFNNGPSGDSGHFWSYSPARRHCALPPLRRLLSRRLAKCPALPTRPLPRNLNLLLALEKANHSAFVATSLPNLSWKPRLLQAPLLRLIRTNMFRLPVD